MEFLYEYGLFLAKAVTLVVAILAVVIGIIAMSTKHKRPHGELELTDISEELEHTLLALKQRILPKEEFKKLLKEQKKQHKEDAKADKPAKGKLFVIDFKGSMDAHEVESLRQEVTAVLQIYTEGDEVLIRLESPGGVVHGYGLAASQLQRIRERSIPLTVVVDKVAASGGYMMACIADKIVAAPFAIIGSIGVIAQVPNFNKILKKNDIDFEQVTAGEYKRTLTLFGENTEKGREKFQEEINETHQLFKNHVSQSRPQLDMARVATGEHWYGQQALDLGLVDSLQTSDDFLLQQVENKTIYKLQFVMPKKLSQKLTQAASMTVEQSVMKIWEKMTAFRGV